MGAFFLGARGRGACLGCNSTRTTPDQCAGRIRIVWARQNGGAGAEGGADGGAEQGYRDDTGILGIVPGTVWVESRRGGGII